MSARNAHRASLAPFYRAFLAAAALVWLAAPAGARPPIRQAFFDAYPDAVGTRLDDLPSAPHHCGVCHYDFDGGGPLNPYGEAVAGTNRQPDGILSLDGLDSDGDGFANGVEILDPDNLYTNTPTFPGLTIDNVDQVSNVLLDDIIDYLTPTTGGDTTPPEVTVVFPNGGEVFTSGDPQTIQWTATDDSGIITAVSVYVSFDGGQNFDPLAVRVPHTGSLTWFVHNRPTTQALVRVEAFDPANNMGWDESDDFFEIVSAPGGRVPTTLRDFDMPGTQPLGALELREPTLCQTCHGDYDPTVEPYFNWAGSMMAQASIDPLFAAALEVANLDAPESGDLCLRCHTSAAWIAGRSQPTDGSQVLPQDLMGVSCDLCHRLVDPIYEPGNPVEDIPILDGLRDVPTTFTSAQYVVDPNGLRRGPYDDPAGGHDAVYSPFHREAALCGTCHDVSNPVFVRLPDGTYVPNDFDAPADSFESDHIGPVERTYSEWFYSEFNPVFSGNQQGVYAPEFGGNRDYVSTCQDCHMRDVTGQGCIVGPERQDLPLHDMTGGSTWLPDILDQVDPNVNVPALQAGIKRARYMLQNAARLELLQVGDSLRVRVINRTGHKLPTGYPEGRRMWINVRFYDDQNNLVGESGAYDPVTATLIHDDEIKVYEAVPVISQDLADVVGLPANTPFHFVLNDTILKDNRIPPLGFSNAEYERFGGAPVGAVYADGQNWDVTAYAIPPGAVRAEVTLYYQSVSREYAEFLRDNGLPGGAGESFYNLWDANGRCPPEPMIADTLTFAPHTPGDTDGDGDVDIVDFSTFTACFSGSGVPYPEDCTPADLDGDGDVDIVDFATFAGNFTGSQ